MNIEDEPEYEKFYDFSKTYENHPDAIKVPKEDKKEGEVENKVRDLTNMKDEEWEDIDVEDAKEGEIEEIDENEENEASDEDEKAKSISSINSKSDSSDPVFSIVSSDKKVENSQEFEVISSVKKDLNSEHFCTDSISSIQEKK